MTSLETRGRKPGQPKVGGATNGSIHVHSNEVKAAVLKIFAEVNEDDKFLREIAAENPKLFLSLLVKLIPSEVAIDHKVTAFDMGSMMAEATERLARMTAEPLAQQSEPVVINPQPEPVTPARPQAELLDERLLPMATGERETFPGYE